VSDAVRALLFDLGGVVIDIDWDRAFAHWARHAGVDPAHLRSRFAFDPHYERHERGEIDAAAYYQSLRASLGIDVPHEVFDAGWKSIFPGAIEPTVAVLERLHGRVPLYLFSNTNRAHQDAWTRQFAPALARFERIFTSCEIGARKPDRAAFERVAEAIGLPPRSILFFDDTAVNVEGARAIGMPAVLVRGPDDVRRAVAPWLAS
jgi:putative hydrolase of the HAD superfamily